MHELLQNSGWLAAVVVAVVLVYMSITLRLVRKNAKLLWIPALLVAICGTLLYWNAFGSVGVSNWFSRFMLSITNALDLFLFKVFSSLGLAPYFYSNAATPEALREVIHSHLVLLYGIYLCAIWTTSILTVHLFARRFSSRIWLAFHRPAGARTHLFFGDGPESLALAADLAAHEKEARILIVTFPEADILPSKLSLLQMFRGVSANTERQRSIRTRIPDAVILSAKTKPARNAGDNLFREMGLPGLERWMACPGTFVYLLSAGSEENLSLLQSFPDSPARFFCRADAKGLSEGIGMFTGKQVTFIDKAYLTTKQMKTDPSFFPVHFVQRALDADGEPLGWVETPFHAMVLGFGETGRGAVDFLYEFGAFTGKDKNPVPFTCEVLDRNASQMAGTFIADHPGIPDGRVVFSAIEAGSDLFWKHLAQELPTLNYIVLALGDDQRNVRQALSILEMICRTGTARPAVVVELDDPEKYGGMLRFHAGSLGVDCVRILGGVGAWTRENVIDETFERYARLFYSAYGNATGDPKTWEERAASIRQADRSPLWKNREYRRKVEQDYSDYLHARVKAELCPSSFLQDEAVADSIPVVYAGRHCTLPSAASVLEYLAVGEHIRWVAAHEIAGYSCGETKREDLKVHPAIRDYASLSEETRHYDWIVVKTTLQVLRQEG